MENQDRAMRYARQIARMIQVDTVRRPGADKENFDRLHAVMAELFPRVFEGCRRWEFESSLLFCWPGKTRRALVLMSHQDVVEAPGAWKYPPFSGTIAEGKLWGRGALDVKGNLHDIFQAVADRHQVELEVLRSNEPSPVTDPRGEAFVRVERAIQAAWPGTEVLPFLLSGGTDTKHFVSLCPNCLRFTAYRISADQQVRCHAIDENIDLDTIPNGVDFFKNLIQGL